MASHDHLLLLQLLRHLCEGRVRKVKKSNEGGREIKRGQSERLRGLLELVPESWTLLRELKEVIEG